MQKYSKLKPSPRVLRVNFNCFLVGLFGILETCELLVQKFAELMPGPGMLRVTFDSFSVCLFGLVET